MKLPYVGELTQDEVFGSLVSQPLPIPLFGVEPRRIVLEGYQDDARPEDFHTAIGNLLSAPPESLLAATPFVYQYYDTITKLTPPEERVLIGSPADVWHHVQFGNDVVFERRDEDKLVYCSLECSCDWEREHGLQLVFRNGITVTKVGPFDSHLSNADAFGDPSLEDVVYKP